MLGSVIDAWLTIDIDAAFTLKVDVAAVGVTFAVPLRLTGTAGVKLPVTLGGVNTAPPLPRGRFGKFAVKVAVLGPLIVLLASPAGVSILAVSVPATDAMVTVLTEKMLPPKTLTIPSASTPVSVALPEATISAASNEPDEVVALTPLTVPDPSTEPKAAPAVTVALTEAITLKGAEPTLSVPAEAVMLAEGIVIEELALGPSCVLTVPVA